MNDCAMFWNARRYTVLTSSDVTEAKDQGLQHVLEYRAKDTKKEYYTEKSVEL